MSKRGSITALIGPNGAGKTTHVRPAQRLRPARFAADPLCRPGNHRLAPHRIARLGLVRTFQLTRVFAGMSVMDNMLLAAPRQPGEHLLLLMSGPGEIARSRNPCPRQCGGLAGNLRAGGQGTRLCRFALGRAAQAA